MATDATFGQAAHILHIVEEKGTPKDQLQSIIGAGLLADLLDANVGEVNRNEFRRILGLKPLLSSYDPDRFFRNREGLWVSNDFRRRVVANATPSAESRAVATKRHELPRDMNDADIEQMFGKNRIFCDDALCDTIAEMIEKQWGGKEGELLSNGYANLFYTSSCVVYVYWCADGRGWGVDAYDRRDYRWPAGRQAFSPATTT